MNPETPRHARPDEPTTAEHIIVEHPGLFDPPPQPPGVPATPAFDSVWREWMWRNANPGRCGFTRDNGQHCRSELIHGKCPFHPGRWVR